jgi:hypothetical protein
MEIAGISLRDILLGVAGLVGVYLAVMVLRLTRLRRPADTPRDTPAMPEAEAADDDEAGEDLVYSVPPVAPRPALAAAPVADFSAELARSQQDGETRQLREEVLQLREEVGQLRAEIADLKAARHVSPQYADAMALAQRGLTAQDVADRCNISLGEAELVWALSRDPSNFDEEEDYGGEPRVEHARSA